MKYLSEKISRRVPRSACNVSDKKWKADVGLLKSTGAGSVPVPTSQAEPHRNRAGPSAWHTARHSIFPSTIHTIHINGVPLNAPAAHGYSQRSSFHSRNLIYLSAQHITYTPSTSL